MSKIDLHGLTHQEVGDELLKKVILEYNKGNLPIHIITGKSEKMRILVKKILTPQFRVADSINNNYGVLRVDG